jgi:hypothetical protein
MILRKYVWAGLAALAFLGSGCAKEQEVIIVSAEGHRAGEAEVDGDAWALLPPGAVIWLRADAKKMFESEVGEELARSMKDILPFAKDAGIEPAKDVDLFVGGLYATVGSDAVGICRGRFKKAATATSIEKNPTTQLGRPIVTTEYSGATMYVADQVALSILTDQTMIFGTQLGVRRVLERIEEGRLSRNLPPWYEALLTDGAAEFQLGVDLDSQPIPAAFGEKVSFIRGMRAARLLGNFRPPGLNFAGTLTYDDPLKAEAAAEELTALRDDLGKWALLLAALSIPQPIERLDARASDKETQVAAEFSGPAVAKILQNAAQFAGDADPAEWLPN